jgi:hypothetical protein
MFQKSGEKEMIKVKSSGSLFDLFSFFLLHEETENFENGMQKK